MVKLKFMNLATWGWNEFSVGCDGRATGRHSGGFWRKNRVSENSFKHRGIFERCGIRENKWPLFSHIRTIHIAPSLLTSTTGPWWQFETFYSLVVAPRGSHGVTCILQQASMTSTSLSKVCLNKDFQKVKLDLSNGPSGICTILAFYINWSLDTSSI